MTRPIQRRPAAIACGARVSPRSQALASQDDAAATSSTATAPIAR